MLLALRFTPGLLTLWLIMLLLGLRLSLRLLYLGLRLSLRLLYLRLPLL
jgi:hypothetical protein